MMEFLNVLSREEMKNVKGKGGNIYCWVGETQVDCRPGYSLLECLDGCIDIEEEGNGSCGGCSQFPELE